MRTFVIGRSQYADIVLADASVARRHAELVVTEAGRHHLTDCASGAGTWLRRQAEAGHAEWQALRQAFIDADMTLKLGDYVCSSRDLLRQVEEDEGGGTAAGAGTRPGSAGAAESGRWRPGLQGGQDRERLRGRVERDPVTGEIVRKRI